MESRNFSLDSQNDQFVSADFPRTLRQSAIMQGPVLLAPSDGSTRPPWVPLPTLKPALQPKVELGLTCTYISLYGILFLMVYIQLWMIWSYGHKRFSYQTVFLYLALVWSGLRVTLFAFYFNDCSRVNMFPFCIYWLLFCFPVCLQFIILCLLVFFFAQVLFKARARYEPSLFKRPLQVVLSLAVLLFMGTNMSCAAISRHHPTATTHASVVGVSIRVAVNDSLFIIMSFVLSFCILRMAKMSSASVVLEAKGTTRVQAVLACVLTVLLYLSRAIYNIVAVVNRSKKIPSFGYSWTNVTDQADFVKLDEGYAYASFAIVLFVWELLPMFIVILFFRVRKPGSSGTAQDLPSHNHNSAYFFDNPHRYDSDDELDNNTANGSIQSGRGLRSHSLNSGDLSNSLNGTPTRPHRLGYGAVMTADHMYGSSGSPIIASPAVTGYQQ